MNILIYTPNAFKISETFIKNQFKYQKKHLIIGLCDKIIDDGRGVENEIIKISSIPISFLDRIKSLIHKKVNKLYKYSFPLSTEKKIINLIKNKNIDLIHCNYGTSALKFLNIIKKTKIPFIVHFHGYDASKSLNDKYYTSYLPELFNLSNSIITVSDNMMNNLKTYISKENLRKLVVIPYGTDLQKILKYPKVKKENKKINILHVGRLTPKKGVLDLVKVVNQVIKNTRKNIRLNIIGSGEEFKSIQNFISNNEIIEIVKLSGALNHDEVIKKMLEADIFVLNSRVAPDGDREGFPNVIIEAMACELAIVSTYHAGIPMAITNEKEGLLVDEKNNEQLENAILRLIENPHLRLELAKNAKEKALKYFSVETMIEKYNEIYESI